MAASSYHAWLWAYFFFVKIEIDTIHRGFFGKRIDLDFGGALGCGLEGHCGELATHRQVFHALLREFSIIHNL